MVSHCPTTMTTTPAMILTKVFTSVSMEMPPHFLLILLTRIFRLLLHRMQRQWSWRRPRRRRPHLRFKMLQPKSFYRQEQLRKFLKKATRTSASSSSRSQRQRCHPSVLLHVVCAAPSAACGCRRRRPALAHERAHRPQNSGAAVFTHALLRTADEFIAAGVRRGVPDAAGPLKATARKWASGVSRDIG